MQFIRFQEAQGCRRTQIWDTTLSATHQLMTGKLGIFEITHLAMEDFFDDGRNWIEDYGQENGNYINTCVHCGRLFKGNKRRVVCKLCDEVS